MVQGRDEGMLLRVQTVPELSAGQFDGKSFPHFARLGADNRTFPVKNRSRVKKNLSTPLTWRILYDSTTIRTQKN